MKKYSCRLYLISLLLTYLGCVKPYEPAVITAANNFLVVDGIINCAPNSVTSIMLTRTRKLSDTVTTIPENKAQLTIEAQEGGQYTLQEQGDGKYTSMPLSLDPGNHYRLKILTSDGQVYASDFAPVVITPPIDSLNWKQSGTKISIFVNTHDPKNNTRYYRWEYDETWEYHAAYESFLKLVNDKVAFRDSTELTYACWHTNASTDILQLSTAQLSEDVVKEALLTELSSQSPKFEEKYSINAKQFALTKEAYEYWQILKRNTQQLGSIFDAQPSQLIGNLHNLKNVDEPVIGYITASSMQEKRLFIRRYYITDPYHAQSDCKVTVVPTDSAYYYLKKPLSALAYYVGSGGFAVAISTVKCVDCQLQGGTLQRPSFWQ
jgi:hypothetical protein